MYKKSRSPLAASHIVRVLSRISEIAAGIFLFGAAAFFVPVGALMIVPAIVDSTWGIIGIGLPTFLGGVGCVVWGWRLLARKPLDGGYLMSPTAYLIASLALATVIIAGIMTQDLPFLREWPVLRVPFALLIALIFAASAFGEIQQRFNRRGHDDG